LKCKREAILITRPLHNKLSAILLLVCMTFLAMPTQAQQVVEDFQSYSDGDLPTSWKFLDNDELKPFGPQYILPEIKFEIKEEAGNKFVRAHVKDRYHRIILKNGEDFDWSVSDNQYLQWDWRAIQLPKKANEMRGRSNDTGGAVYVYFDKKDFWGRPRAIKYTYSSTQAIGKSKKYGALKLIVVSTGADKTNEWITVRRNVAEDYQKLFGERMKEDPVLIALWSDSDNTDETAIVDFDNIKLTP